MRVPYQHTCITVGGSLPQQEDGKCFIAVECAVVRSNGLNQSKRVHWAALEKKKTVTTIPWSFSGVLVQVKSQSQRTWTFCNGTKGERHV